LAVIKTIRRFVDSLGLIKTVTVIEAEVWEIREVFGENFQNGLAAADLLILNKTEAMTPEAVSNMVAGIRAAWPDLTVHPTSHGRIDPDLFFGPPRLRSDPSEGAPEEALAGYASAGLETGSPIPEAAWEAFMARWGGRLERIKGQLLLSGGRFYLDRVRGREERRPALPDVSGTRLVLIGRGFEAAELEAVLADLAAEAD
jgi:G3E family GTPase